LQSATGWPVHAAESVIANKSVTVSQLPTNGHIYIYIPTTTAQNRSISEVYSAHEAAANKGEKYNALTNSCETTARQALAAAGINPNLLQTGIPTADLFLDLARGAARITPLKAAHHPKDK